MINTATDKGAYILGILWGTMSIWEEGFWVRQKDRWFVEAVRNHLGITATVQEVASSTGPQYRLKIVRTEWVQVISDLLKHHGWTPRMAKERPYPSGLLNDRGFCRAWVELHGAADIRWAWRDRKKTAQYPQKRLRVYGNQLLLEDMNYILSAAAGLQPRKLQKTTNEITKALYFQGKAVQPVVVWLYNKAEIWNPEAKARLEFYTDIDAVE